MSSYIGIALGFLSGVVQAALKILEILKTKKMIEEAKKQKEAEIAKHDAEVTRQQTEILIQDRSKKDVIDKMKDGTF